MDELEHIGLMYANMEVKNIETGEIIFKMKRKDDYGSLYYLFEKYEDKMTQEDKINFPIAWDIITMGAALLGIPLYDSKELMQGITGRTIRLLKSKEGKRAIEEADKTGKTVLIKDIQVSVFDHGTKKIDSITVGLSVPPRASQDLENIGNLKTIRQHKRAFSV